MYFYESSVFSIFLSPFFLYKITFLIRKNKNLNCASWINLFIILYSWINLFIFVYDSQNIVLFDEVANNRLIEAD